jgi:hypothetical protein
MRALEDMLTAIAVPPALRFGPRRLSRPRSGRGRASAVLSNPGFLLVPSRLA